MSPAMGGRALAATAAGVGDGAATALSGFRRSAMSLRISARVSGPRRYDSAQRVWNTTGCVLVDVVHQEHAARRGPRACASMRGAVEAVGPPRPTPSSPSSTRSLSRSVCSRPRNQVPQLASPL